MKRKWMKSAVLCCAFCVLASQAFAAETVSLRLDRAPVREVLRNLADMCGKNIIFSGDIKATVSANLKNMAPEDAMRAVIRAGGLAAHEEGGVLILYDGTAAGERTNAGTSAEHFKLSYADAKEVAETLEDIYKDKHVAYNKSANSVIISGTPDELMRARGLIRAMDIPEKQVKVEAEVLAVNRSDAKELGIDWDFKSLTGSANYTRDSWSEQHYVTDADGNVRYDSDGNPRIRNIEHDGWNVTAPEGYAGISYGRSITGHPYTFFFQAKLNALISKGKAKVLAKPNVVTMNGRKAEILIGSRIPVIVEHMENGVKTTATEYKDAGIKLSYTPRISRDDEITAAVSAEVSTPYLVPEMKAYRIITRQADTLVRLRSGDELVIGGLIDEETSHTFRKVPILGDIPILGKLFQSKKTSKEESEIIIIIRAELVDSKKQENNGNTEDQRTLESLRDPHSI